MARWLKLNRIWQTLIELRQRGEPSTSSIEALQNQPAIAAMNVLRKARTTSLDGLAVLQDLQTHLSGHAHSEHAHSDDALALLADDSVCNSVVSFTAYDASTRAQATLDSIADAVISTDECCVVTYLNAMAENLTGWTRQAAVGRPFDEVVPLIDCDSGEPVNNPMKIAMDSNQVVNLAPNCVLISRDGLALAIEDSTAPIHDQQGHVTGAVMVFRDVSATRALAAHMAHMAQHDSLTDLPNRLLFSDRVEQALKLARRHQQTLAVLFVDIDGFKSINDSLGHVIGDHLLKAIADRPQENVRKSDTVSRRGGDEFVILLPQISDHHDHIPSAEKLLQAIRTPFRIDDREFHLTASIGAATYPDDGEDAETLLLHADMAMYRAKRDGRDNYQFFRTSIQR
jgi:diguanylate cyclase (GGDEF)-like protein/PAS domain S-box-containing protein